MSFITSALIDEVFANLPFSDVVFIHVFSVLVDIAIVFKQDKCSVLVLAQRLLFEARKTSGASSVMFAVATLQFYQLQTDAS